MTERDVEHSAEKDAVAVVARNRRGGKTTEAVQWVLAGEATDSYPFWTRVLLVPTIEAADQTRRQFPALDYRQVFAWNEWRSARLGVRPVEVAFDNADILIAQTIGQVARFVTLTGRVTPPAERRTEGSEPHANWSELHDQGDATSTEGSE